MIPSCSEISCLNTLSSIETPSGNLLNRKITRLHIKRVCYELYLWTTCSWDIDLETSHTHRGQRWRQFCEFLPRSSRNLSQDRVDFDFAFCGTFPDRYPEKERSEDTTYTHFFDAESGALSTEGIGFPQSLTKLGIVSRSTVSQCRHIVHLMLYHFSVKRCLRTFSRPRLRFRVIIGKPSWWPPCLQSSALIVAHILW